MAVALFTQWPAGAAETSQRVTDLINQRLVDGPPAGMIYHAEGPTAESGWWTFNVWEAEEALRTFHRDILHPVLAEVGASRGQSQQLEVIWDSSQMHS